MWKCGNDDGNQHIIYTKLTTIACKLNNCVNFVNCGRKLQHVNFFSSKYKF